MSKLYIEKRRRFPDPREATMDGIVSMGDDWDLQTLLEAYSFGIFPWPHPEMPCLWFCPDQRGILEFSELHIPKSLKKMMRKKPFEITFNKAFEKVIGECAMTPRPGQDGTWITPPLMKAYKEFHQAGYAHSVEAWQNGELVGGLYGVHVGGVFSAESMFYKKDNASKICLVSLIEKIKSAGFTWLDIQMTTPVTESLGGKYISKDEFLKKIKAAHLTARPFELN